jgi:hypothetical protein
MIERRIDGVPLRFGCRPQSSTAGMAGTRLAALPVRRFTA